MNTPPAALAAERTARWALPAFALFAVASISLQNLVYVAAAAWVFGMAVRRQWRLTPTPMNIPMLALAAVLVAASLLAGRLNPSLFGLRKIGIMIVFFLTAAVADHPVRAERCLNLFLIGALIAACGSIVKHLLGVDGGRATSFSGDYMAAGGMYMLAFLLILSRWLHSRERSRWFWLGAAGIVGLALLFTYTRSAWLGAAAGLVVLGLFKDWRLPALALVAGAAVLILFPHSAISQRILTLRSSHAISSNQERTYMWRSGLEMVRDRPWFGYGVDNLSEHYRTYADPHALEQSPPHVHNTVMQLALNGGLAASACYLWWVVVVVVFGYKAWKRLGSKPEYAGAAAGLTAAFVGFAVNGLFEFNFGASQVISIVYFLTGLLPAYAYADPQGPVWTLPDKPRVLFLRPRFRGDVVLASPLPRLVKRDYPKARVDLLSEPSTLGAAMGEPEWDHIISLPRRDKLAWWRTVRHIRRRDYDAVCDLFGNPRTALLSALSGARMKIGPRVRVWDVLYLIRTQADRKGPRPAWESFYDILRALGFKQLSLRPRWVVNEEDRLWIKSFLKDRRVQPGKILGLFPGGSHPAKRWPLERFLEVARRAPSELGLKAMFVFGPKEKDLTTEYMHAEGKQSLSVEGLPPGRLAALWSQCAAVVSNDAFPMHLGPAVGTPTLGLFGPGRPDIWFPYPEKNGHRALHAPPSCWPCGRDECPDTRCWDQLTPDLVLRTLAEILRPPSPGDTRPRSHRRKTG